MVIPNCYGTHKSCLTICLDSLTDENNSPSRMGGGFIIQTQKMNYEQNK